MSTRGLEFFPRRGPVLIAARHYHHLYDGATLIRQLPRNVHIFVALDWVNDRHARLVMEFACASARWPVALRPQRFADAARAAAPNAYAKNEIARYLRRSLADGARLLLEKRVLAVFPEGFPAIEPGANRTRGEAEFLPFQGGFANIAALAQRQGAGRVPIVPAGFSYTPIGNQRYRVVLRLGAPLYLDSAPSRKELVHAIERRVRELSA
jgi:1-acyl-sn-glycerol-3-phosphate acyltransferase